MAPPKAASRPIEATKRDRLGFLDGDERRNRPIRFQASPSRHGGPTGSPASWLYRIGAGAASVPTVDAFRGRNGGFRNLPSPQPNASPAAWNFGTGESINHPR